MIAVLWHPLGTRAPLLRDDATLSSALTRSEYRLASGESNRRFSLSAERATTLPVWYLTAYPEYWGHRALTS